MCEKNNLSPQAPKKGGGKVFKKETKKLSQILKVHISRLRYAILLKFGMLGAEGGGRLQYKDTFNSRREHGATYA